MNNKRLKRIGKGPRVDLRRQEGAILVVSLLLLLVLTLLGVTVMQTTRLEERMAGNVQDTNVSFQGAEAALRDGEESLRSLTARPTTCAGLPCTAVVQRDALPDLRNQSPNWWTANGRVFGAAGELPALEREPRFIVEEAGFVPDSLTVGHGPPDGRSFYRVTAHSTGATVTARTVVESTYARRF